MTIGIDMMGGDFAPVEAVKGLAMLQHDHSANLVLIGDNVAIEKLLQDFSIHIGNIQVVHSGQVIGMHEHPTKALKEKTDSSISIGFQLLSSGKIDAFISAGNTGAMMVGALYSIKAIPGILRPTIGAYLPRENGQLGLLADVGLNADCKPENLSQFATLGSLFVKHILNISDPKVALVNIGEEEGKGNILAQASFPLLRDNKHINFIGNVEGRDLLTDKADVMICDGFTGNVLLKFAESIYDIVQRRDIHDEHFNRFNFESYGGVPVLGVNKPVIIGHGISHAIAFKNMVLMAEKMITKELVSKIIESFKVA